MRKNPILEELYAVRSQMLAEHGEHLAEYLHDEFERLRAAGHPVAQFAQRSVRPAGAIPPHEAGGAALFPGEQQVR